jgi:geranylgeranyl diphosphate synthase type II
LVHDDLPAFDDADLRRGIPTVHKKFSQALAVLVGDGLIAHAIKLGCAPEVPTHLQGAIVSELADCVGALKGLVAGQAWESEPGTPLREYHQLKTGALFETAARLGAVLAGSADPDAWSRAGLLVGEAYQIADDIRDSLSPVDDKPLGQDLLHDRPSALREMGIREAMRSLHGCIEAARTAVPTAAHPEAFHAWIDAASARLRVVDPAAPSAETSGVREEAAPTATLPPLQAARAAG